MVTLNEQKGAWVREIEQPQRRSRCTPRGTRTTACGVNAVGRQRDSRHRVVLGVLGRPLRVLLDKLNAPFIEIGTHHFELSLQEMPWYPTTNSGLRPGSIRISGGFVYTRSVACANWVFPLSRAETHTG